MGAPASQVSLANRRSGSVEMGTVWRIELFGGLRAVGGREIRRFRTQKTGALLAYLAYHLDQTHPRELLGELLWQELDPERGRGRLRQALASLRRQLESPLPPTPAGRVLLADRHSVGLNPAAVTTDVREFETALHAAAHSGQPQALAEAIDRYSGELLPGYYEDWVLPERERLAERFFQAACRLARQLEARGDWDGALEYAGRAVRADPLREEAHEELIRLLAAAGRPAAAVRQYRALERILAREIGATPGDHLRQLARELARAPSRSGAAAPDAGSVPPGDGTAKATRSRPPAVALVDQGEIPGGIGGPPLTGVRTGNLPPQLNRFFGRRAELAQLEALLTPGGNPHTDDTDRLVTLTGLGGCGKSRLALEAGRHLLAAYRGAVWFVSLVEVTEAGRIPDAVADALCLKRSPEISTLDQVVGALTRPAPGSPVLLVLDNFEQLVDEGAAVVQALLERAPALACLVTSRRALGLSGERQFPVSPLPTPRGPAVPATLAESESVQLFMDRAQAVRPDFALTERNAAAVAGLCERLEGIPLAIELAAARSSVLTPSQMLAQLEGRFDFLSTRRRDIAERHRTLRATLEWSFRLLPPDLERFLVRLSVFRGGWALEAAEAVCGGTGVMEYRGDGAMDVSDSPDPITPPLQHSNTPLVTDPLDLLAQLRECSLILAEERREGMRFRMLETVREYAAGQLEAKEREALAARHAAFFLQLAERAQTLRPGPEQVLRLEEVEREHDNLRAALGWALEGDAETALRLVWELFQFWYLHGYVTEGREWLEQANARGAACPAAVRARALLAASCLAGEQADNVRSAALCGESIALFREARDPLGLARAQSTLGMICLNGGDYAAATTHLEAALSPLREFGHEDAEAVTLRSLGRVATEQGDYARATALFEASREGYQRLQAKPGVTSVLAALASVARFQGHYARAAELYEESLRELRALGIRPGVAAALRGLGAMALRQQERERARGLLSDSLVLVREARSRREIAALLEEFAELARQEGSAADAARLLAAAGALRDAIGAPLPPNERPAQAALLAALRDALGEPDFTVAWQSGWGLTWEEAAALALQEREPAAGARAHP